MLLNNQWITGEIKEEMKKYLETNANKNTMIQNQNTAKAILIGKFREKRAYIMNEKNLKLILYKKELEEKQQQQQTKLKVRRKEKQKINK